MSETIRQILNFIPKIGIYFAILKTRNFATLTLSPYLFAQTQHKTNIDWVNANSEL